MKTPGKTYRERQQYRLRQIERERAQQAQAPHRTAYHEAGHAVAALLNTIPVTSISIFNRDGNKYRINGRTSYLLMRHKDLLAARIKVALAGEAAETAWGCLLNGTISDSEGALIARGAQGDEIAINEYVEMLREGGFEVSDEEVMAATIQALKELPSMVAANFNRIQALAEELVRSGSLQRADIERLTKIHVDSAALEEEAVMLPPSEEMKRREAIIDMQEGRKALYEVEPTGTEISVEEFNRLSSQPSLQRLETIREWRAQGKKIRFFKVHPDFFAVFVEKYGLQQSGWYGAQTKDGFDLLASSAV